MQFNLNTNVTLFLSVRKGLESCLLNEIKNNKLLNNICRIRKKREFLHNFEDTDTHFFLGTYSYLSSIELREEPSSDCHKWIRLNSEDKSIEELKPETLNLNKTEEPTSTRLRDSCNIYVQPGGLEVKCNLDWLIKCSLFVKSAESIWLRIGNPFRCHSEDQLTTFISKLPWFLYFSPNFIDTVPLRIISRYSNLWSSHTIDSCVRKGIRLSFDNCKKDYNKIFCAEDTCISLILNRNTCYLAYQFSGRLSPRFYNFQFLEGDRADYSKYIPSWSLTSLKKQLIDNSGTEKDLAKTNRESSVESLYSKRKDYISLQHFLTNDFSDTSDSLIAGFLRDKEILRALTSKVQNIWDPFCGNGLLICELMSMLLSLPNYVPDKSQAINSFFSQNLKEFESNLLNYIDSSGPKKVLNIIGSDTSSVKLTEANSKILRFFSFYQHLLGDLEPAKTHFPINSTIFKSYSFFPLTIHNCSPDKLSHYLRNTLILTKIPYVDIKDKNKFETIKTYKLFGQVVSSKCDWKGVFAIARGRLFEYYSGLEWKKLVNSTNSKSEIKLLKWTGRTRQFRSVNEKLDQLNEVDFSSSSFIFSKKNSQQAKLYPSPVKVAIVGSTGSVGTQALNVIRNMNRDEKKFEVVALTALKNFESLSQQAEEFMPKVCHILNNSDRLEERMNHKCDVLTGKHNLLDMCQNLDYDVLLMAISGCAGIEPTLSAARSGKKLALANKESVVSAGKLLSRLVKQSGTTVIPVDSEHNAIFQCLDDGSVDAKKSNYVCNISQNSLQKVKSLILTSSGGPFRGSKFSDYKRLRMSDNISHPVWSMGSKITVDSSTMMNKALELIEAHHLFGIPFEHIRILVHKECIVHSMVEFIDNSILAQMYLPDMCLPISHSLNWPNRSDNGLPSLDLTKHTLSFAEPDMENFPFIKLGYEVGRKGGLYPAVFNAANDMANELFRKNLINYDQLHDLVHDTVHLFNPLELTDDRIEDVLVADSWAKRKVRQLAQNT